MNEELQIAVFHLTKEEYALPITKVKSIIKLLPITKLPNSPLFMEGIVNLRGEIIPIVDLRSRFNLPIYPNTEDSRMIIVDFNRQTIGIIVDNIAEVIRVPVSEIDIPPAAAKLNTNYITGICKYNARLIALLDIDKVLTGEEAKELKTMNG